MNVEIFERHRGRLTAIAYGMLGSLSDAEDVVQDAWLRWAQVDPSRIERPAAFLTTVVTRLAIDRLRSARRRRETYVGPWLPEPIVTELDDDPAETVAEAERLSLALLTALERLNPVERAVFLLRDVFDLDYAELAEVVRRSPENCRQIAARARARVGDPDRAGPAGTFHDTELVAAFMTAASAGDLDRLVELLAADAVAWTDGGAARRAARHPIVGAGRIARFFAHVVRAALASGAAGRLVRVNGRIGVLTEDADGPFAVTGFEVVDDQIVAIRSVLNPAKLPTMPVSRYRPPV